MKWPFKLVTPEDHKAWEEELLHLKLANMSILTNYKSKAAYSTARSQLVDMIIKKGYARYEAEALLTTLWALNDKDPKKTAWAIANLKGGRAK